MDITFGFNVDPRVGPATELAGLARTAERSGFDLIGIQDHPYQPGFYDTWSLITYLAAKTERIAFTPNVANLGLRPPAMLAKAAASVSALLGGRIQLGVGAGAGGGPIPSMGGPDRTGKRMLRYVRESLTVMRRALDGGVVRLDGNEVDVRGYQAGPVPPERIELWLGAVGPAMLANVGRYADGWMSPGSAYLEPSMVPGMRSAIDESAAAAGRDPSEVRRIYNVFGGVGTRSGRGFEGPSEQWVEWITTWARLVLAAAAEPELMMQVRSLGGAIFDVVPDATAFGNRHQSTLVIATTFGAATRGTLNRRWVPLEAHFTGAYGNFESRPTAASLRLAYPAATRKRLRELKSRYDPQGVLRALP